MIINPCRGRELVSVKPERRKRHRMQRRRRHVPSDFAGFAFSASCTFPSESTVVPTEPIFRRLHFPPYDRRESYAK